jgi:putative (di)nucleoside polyphosphate hydrolase
MGLASCGVLIVCGEAELLLCHATGTPRWDIPKGLPEPGESPAATAARECREECGLAVEPAALAPLGRFAYRPGKDLLLHALLVERFDSARCRCDSLFTDRRGVQRPEMDGFRWTPFTQVPRHCGKSMAALLSGPVSLPQVLLQLKAAAPPLVLAPPPRPSPPNR